MKLDEAVRAIHTGENVVHRTIAGLEGSFIRLTPTWSHTRNAPKAVIQTDQEGPPTSPRLEPGQNYVRFGQFERGGTSPEAKREAPVTKSK